MVLGKWYGVQGVVSRANFLVGALENMIIADHPPRSPPESLPGETIPRTYFGAFIFRVQGFKGSRVPVKKIIL